MHQIKVENLGGGPVKVYLDANKVRATKMDVHFEAGCMPETEISLFCEPEMEYESLVTLDFSPKTVKCAVDVLKAALIKNDFVAFMGMSDLNKVMAEKNGR